VWTSIDDGVARWVADHRLDVLDDITIWMADLSGLLGVLAAIGVVIMCAAVWFGGLRPVVQIVVVLAAVSLLTRWMKPAIDRPRPPRDLALYDTYESAMPSSHALITAAIVVAVVMADWWTSERLRRMVLVAGVVGCLVVGAAMVYLGVHWVTDVLVGWVLGVGLTWPLMRVAQIMSPAARSGRTSAPPRRPPPG
jgi:undecaprenyl-diphosphatase